MEKIIIPKKIRIVAFIMSIMGVLIVFYPLALTILLISLMLDFFEWTILSVISLGIAFFMFLLSHFLHKAKKWAWVVSIIFFSLPFIGDMIYIYFRFMGLDIRVIIVSIIQVICLILLLSGRKDYWRIAAK